MWIVSWSSLEACLLWSWVDVIVLRLKKSVDEVHVPFPQQDSNPCLTNSHIWMSTMVSRYYYHANCLCTLYELYYSIIMHSLSTLGGLFQAQSKLLSNNPVIQQYLYTQGVTKRCRLSWLTKTGPGLRPWGVSANEYSCVQIHGAQINFGDQTPSLTYVYTSPCQCRRRPKCKESSVMIDDHKYDLWLTYIRKICKDIECRVYHFYSKPGKVC